MTRLAERYHRFALEEARGRSPLYELLALGVADDPAVQGVLERVSPDEQQPNLLLAAVAFLGGFQFDYPAFRRFVLEHADAVVQVLESRRTQTNEVGRCAVLLPLLAGLPGPLALLEVGASAGLCLLPDRYAYDYDGHRVDPVERVGAEPPVFGCRASPATPLPSRGLDVVWRAGLDLEPVDLDDDSVAWLEAL